MPFSPGRKLTDEELSLDFMDLPIMSFTPPTNSCSNNTEYDKEFEILKSHVDLGIIPSLSQYDQAVSQDQRHKIKQCQSARLSSSRNERKSESSFKMNGMGSGGGGLSGCRSARAPRIRSEQNFKDSSGTPPDIPLINVSSSLMQNTFSFCKKIDDCKQALNHLKNSSGSTGTAEGIRKVGF